MEFRILGSLEVLDGGRKISVGAGKQRALLGALLLQASRPLAPERLIDELWGADPPSSATNSVHIYVSHLRKALGSERIATRADGYAVVVEPDELDLHRFETLLARGREARGAGADEQAAVLLADALAIWRGHALAGIEFESLAAVAVARLDELRLAALEERLHVEASLGRHAQLVGELEALSAEHPLREELTRQLMIALYRSGRQPEALAVYQRTRRELVDALAIEPSRALQRLERQILAQDPALDLPEREGSQRLGGSAVEPSRGSRKTVSVLVAKPVATTQGDALDPELGRTIDTSCAEAIAAELGRHGATVVGTGDSIAGIFGVPVVHEDDALRATRAGLATLSLVDALSRRFVLERGVGIDVAVAVTTGETYVGGEEPSSMAGGTIFREAARLAGRAGSAELLVDDATLRLVGESVRSERVEQRRRGEQRCWRIEELLPESPPIPLRSATPIVGRESDLAELRRAFDRALRERACRLTTVIGPAGIGKSRLARAFRDAVAPEALTLSGRCPAYGEGVTFRPLLELLDDAGGRTAAELVALLGDEPEAELVAARLAAVAGTAAATTEVEETFWAARRFLETLARARPLVVVLDDLQWAEPTFLDLVEHVASYVVDAPILLVCVARPDLLEVRPEWGGAVARTGTLSLEPLTKADSRVLLDRLLGGRTISPQLRDRIETASEGNPLFIEQMLALLDEPRETGADPAVPPTIQALLAARLDRLRPSERETIECGAIVGREFDLADAHALVAGSDEGEVETTLQALVGKRLLRTHRRGGAAGYRFEHGLIREVAYAAIPKRVRADLHERYAERIGTPAAGLSDDRDELFAYHLEQAATYLRAIGERDERSARLARGAAGALTRGARRAGDRADALASASLWSRALALIEADDSRRPDLLVELAGALRDAGELARAEPVLAEALELGTALGNAGAVAHARVAQLRVEVLTDVELASHRVVPVVNEAIELFAKSSDDRRLAEALCLLAWLAWLQCRAGEAEAALTRALDHARRGGDERARAQALHLLVGTLLFGPTPVPAAAAHCEEILAGSGAQKTSASATRALAGLRAMQGRFDEANELIERDSAILAGLGLPILAAAASEVYGRVRLLEGNLEGAERDLREGFASFERMGDKTSLSTLAATLAQTLYAQGRDDEALELARTSRALAASDDLHTQVQWRGPYAKVLARRGEAEEAVAIAREGVALGRDSDFLDMLGTAHWDLAEVLFALDRTGEADGAIREAHALYDRKGNLVACDAVRARRSRGPGLAKAP